MLVSLPLDPAIVLSLKVVSSVTKVLELSSFMINDPPVVVVSSKVIDDATVSEPATEESEPPVL